MREHYEIETDYGYINIYATAYDFDGITDKIYQIDKTYCKGYRPITTITSYGNKAYVDDIIKRGC